MRRTQDGKRRPRCNKVCNKHIPKCDDDGNEPRDIECSPNGRENEPQRLIHTRSGNQAGVPKEIGYDNNGNTCGLAHTTCTIVEPQGPQVTPHSAPTPTGAAWDLPKSQARVGNGEGTQGKSCKGSKQGWIHHVIITCNVYIQNIWYRSLHCHTTTNNVTCSASISHPPPKTNGAHQTTTLSHQIGPGWHNIDHPHYIRNHKPHLW